MNKNILFIIGSILIVVGMLIVLTVLSDGKDGKLTLEYSQLTDEELEAINEASKIEKVEDLYEGQPYLGKETAPVNIIVFGDYKCIHCFNFEQNVFDELYEKYIKTGVVKYHYANMQMLKSESIVAGVVGEAVFEQSPADFWTYHRAVFKNYSVNFDDSKLISLVEKNTKNVDIEKIKDVLKKPEEKFKEVYADYYKGVQAGVEGTPTILVQGIKAAPDLESIEAIIEAIYDKETKTVMSDKEIEKMIEAINKMNEKE